MSLHDIEELEYSVDLSDNSTILSEDDEFSGDSISTTTSIDSETDEEIPSLNTLKPYDFEPTCEP